MAKLVNPLNYPLGVLIAGICLFLGVRFANLSSLIMLPLSASIAFISSVVLVGKEKEVRGDIDIQNTALETELNNAKNQAKLLIKSAESLRMEAEKLLQDSWQLDLLTTVQYTCDRTLELPEKIEKLSRRLHGGDSLLSVDELNKQLRQVETKQKYSGGMALRQLKQLETTLKNNIELALEGQDAREAQVFSLVNIIIELGGVLQNLQNKLRTSDLTNSEQIQELKSLSQELNNFQDNVDLLI
ncbi:hypothetical protein [Geminocystis sp. NIES-3709]|uniref:hypothetical protein n=1 Tax=Geminocystis sp. NIES-3709 TaxID=1617448 RepID=UPI0005FC6EB9|nr:hypothetical protein [Geminocystis sp. NIES-3709]BAQ66245.1 hypothetical protein GM3709_3010 [Geminocystis sp. NIES-3709]